MKREEMIEVGTQALRMAKTWEHQYPEDLTSEETVTVIVDAILGEMWKSAPDDEEPTE